MPILVEILEKETAETLHGDLSTFMWFVFIIEQTLFRHEMRPKKQVTT